MLESSELINVDSRLEKARILSRMAWAIWDNFDEHGASDGDEIDSVADWTNRLNDSNMPAKFSSDITYSGGLAASRILTEASNSNTDAPYQEFSNSSEVYYS